MNGYLTGFLLGVGILFCGAISVIQLVLVFQGRGGGAVTLFLVSGAVTLGLVVVAVLRIWRVKKFWE
jgi:hypothetical protein